jgi:hypothetical protein
MQLSIREYLNGIIKGAVLIFCGDWFHRQGLRHFVSAFCLDALRLFWDRLDTDRRCKADCSSRPSRYNLYNSPADLDRTRFRLTFISIAVNSFIRLQIVYDILKGTTRDQNVSSIVLLDLQPWTSLVRALHFQKSIISYPN